MANLVYNIFRRKIYSGEIAWNDDTTVRALLVDNSSTYTPAIDHQTIAQMKNLGLVELSTETGYRRATIPDKVVGEVEVNGQPRVALLGGPAQFGAIDPDITIKAIVLFVRVGTTDQDSVDFPIAYIDDSPNLPKVTDGGVVLWNPTSNGYMRIGPCS